MAQIVNNDKLTYILTNYGLDRVAEVLSTPGLSITMTKIKNIAFFIRLFPPSLCLSELDFKNPKKVTKYVRGSFTYNITYIIQFY